MKRRWLRTLSRDIIVAAFRDWFGIQDNQAQVLVTLFERNGRPVKARELGALVSTHRPIGEAAVMERVSGLRSAMEAEAIDTGPRGYLLTEIGRKECRDALTRMAETMMRQGAEVIDPMSEDLERDANSMPLMRLAAGR